MADRGRGSRGGPGGRGRGRGGGNPPPGADKQRREAILDMAKYVDQRIRVKFMGGREVTGVLKGYDQLLNLVLDEVEETLQESGVQRRVGLAVIRGPQITVLSPVDGSEEIENPFASEG
ncbi:Sm-like protein lsm7 [Tulasnella sp. 427]|nr:Sm-like protein lsm7 [Tulasnella sp. 427]